MAADDQKPEGENAKILLDAAKRSINYQQNVAVAGIINEHLQHNPNKAVETFKKFAKPKDITPGSPDLGKDDKGITG